MLYETFNSALKINGPDFFKNKVADDIVQNLNPKFALREYQKEAIGRSIFYFNGFPERQWPAHLLFHMATGSGKTLIMAANILYLYKLGYRNFIFFVNSTNIIEKTKDNFLNPLSEKYLFAQKIKFGEKEVFVKEVQNFEGVNQENINILFTTIQGLHTRLNYPHENAITYEDFEDKEIVLISDEAHHLQTLTRNKLSKTLEEEKKSWEWTVMRILKSNPKNILLEFTATIDLGDQNIRKKYEDKIIFQYDLKQFRLDKYSKEIDVLQADLDPIDRALQAVILSQYRRKIAEKYKIRLKPVILFKSKSIKESKENYDNFLNKIKNLSSKDIEEIKKRAEGTDLEKAFNYFQKENITFDNLIKELQEDFSEEKVMLLDSENIDDEKQLKLNSLESKDNEIRAIFAVNMLNEGWDVLNLFDIVRLYDTRDGKWVGGKYKPGNTTIGEAQLIGRGARYFPFQLNLLQDKYKRKFDEESNHDLRIIETLHYHSAHNPDYITEIKNALTEMGILAEKYKQVSLFIKDSIKKKWKNEYIFINERIKNLREDIKSFADAKIKKEYNYDLKTGEIEEKVILEEKEISKKSKEIIKTKKKYKISDFGKNLIRGALDKIEFYQFKTLKKFFPHLKSIQEFILSPNYLGNVEIEISGPKERLEELRPDEKLEIVLSVIKEISEQAKTNVSEFKGSTLFKAKQLWEIFKEKRIKIDLDDVKRKELTKINLKEVDWFAQEYASEEESRSSFYGTSEEKSFINFISNFIERLKEKYSDILLLRNEKFFQIFDFNEGRPFEPDFVMILKEKNHKIKLYQLFIEPKGEIYARAEPWKQDFLLEIKKRSKMQRDLIMEIENKEFSLIGLPFYNEKLKNKFEEALESEVLS